MTSVVLRMGLGLQRHQKGIGYGQEEFTPPRETDTFGKLSPKPYSLTCHHGYLSPTSVLADLSGTQEIWPTFVLNPNAFPNQNPDSKFLPK